MWKRFKRFVMRRWLRRKFGPMVVGASQAEIDAWIERVVMDRIP